VYNTNPKGFFIMPKLVFLFFMLVSAPVFAQTMEAPMAPPVAAMTAPAAPAMVAPMVAPVVAPVKAVAPVKVVLAPPAVAPAPVAAATPLETTNPETVVSVPVADATKPSMAAAPAGTPSVPKTPTNWPAIITAIGMAITALLSLLGGLGLMKWTKNARVQLVLKATKKGTEAFLAYAEKSPAAWDDAIAKILDNVNAVLLASGEDSMTDAEKAMATKLAVSFKNVTGK
jgi:multisubunit Na+/H+ antiporter MnhG subunit